MASEPFAAPPASPSVETRLAIRPEWVDGNGHMNVACYVLAFDRATDALYDALGVGWDYVARERMSLFTLSMNVDYLRELHAGADVRVATRVVDCDHKRIHYFHEMCHAEAGFLAATNEILAVHVDMATRRSAPFPDAVAARIAAMLTAHARQPLAATAGRTLGIRRAPSPSAGS
jgi:acyl-CoA thioester hydrolase